MIQVEKNHFYNYLWTKRGQQNFKALLNSTPYFLLDRRGAERNLLLPIIFNANGVCFKGQSKFIPCGEAVHKE